MIKGIGTDIIEIKRVAKSLGRPRFVNICYTQAEQAAFNGLPQTAAGFFAAKEAVAKALGTGFSGFSPRDIEIVKNTKNKPEAVLHGNAKAIAEQNGVLCVHVSISHCEEYAVAYAVAEGLL